MYLYITAVYGFRDELSSGHTAASIIILTRKRYCNRSRRPKVITYRYKAHCTYLIITPFNFFHILTSWARHFVLVVVESPAPFPRRRATT